MKKVYFFVLTLITTAFVLGLALLKVNEVCGGELFTIPEQFEDYVNYAKEYGAMTLLCLFAFGGLAGKILKVIIIILIIVAILLIVLSTFASSWLKNIFSKGAKAVLMYC